MAVIARRRKPARPRPEPPPERFAWASRRIGGLAAQVAGEELARLAAASDAPIENLTPASVVDAARPEDAPLHSCFTWDDTTAAELRRRDEARLLLRSIRIVVEAADPESRPTKAIRYIAVRPEGIGPCYVSSVKVMNDADLHEQALASALALLRGVRERFRQLGELRDVFAALDRLDDAG